MKRILNLFLPNRCVMTGRIVQDSGGLSSEGFSKIQFITAPHCDQCGAQLNFSKEVCRLCVDKNFHFDAARSVFIYDENSKKLILQYKYGDRLSLTPIFGKWLMQYGADVLSDADILMPVPLHSIRLRQRMYNQAAELVKEVGKQEDVPYVLDGLLRIKHTLPQGHEDRESRIQNMNHAFKVNSSFEDKIYKKSLVIIDDVMTSGATLNACAATLLPFKPKKISVLTLAKVLLD
jgi:ComF family protein